MPANGLSLLNTYPCRFGVMYAAVDTAVGRLKGGFVKRTEMTGIISKRDLGFISEFKIITQKSGKDCCCSIGNYCMPAGKFREWRRLNKWAPVLIYISINDRYGAYQVDAVFLIPATDKCVEYGN